MRKIIQLTFVFLLFNCSSDNDSNISSNGSPSDFEVYVDSNISNNVQISWSESFDPENEEVKYSVYLENNLQANNLIDRTYSFYNLEQETTYNGEINAYDPNGNSTSRHFSFTTLGNLPPTDFEVISITPHNITTDIVWQESIDPEGGNVLYDVYINNQLVDTDLSNRYYSFQNLTISTIYQAKIVAKDIQGSINTLEFEFETNDGIYQGDLSLSTQNGIENFGALGYAEINGNLELSGFIVNSNITDLSPLESIKIVRGYFDINFLNDLETLSGLGIEHVGYSFRIRQNHSLLDLNGLENLTEVLGAFEIEQNTHLQSISGINNLHTIGTLLRIKNNVYLLSISGFNSLSDVDTIMIDANWSLVEINAFSNVTVLIGDLNIHDNTSLEILTGLNNITSVNRVYIQNTLIANLNSLSSLQVVNVELNINDNDMLENILGLSSLQEITYNDISVGGNEILTSLEGLHNLTQVGGLIKITYNPNLVDFCAIENLVITTPFNIHNNGLDPTSDFCPD